MACEGEAGKTDASGVHWPTTTYDRQGRSQLRARVGPGPSEIMEKKKIKNFFYRQNLSCHTLPSIMAWSGLQWNWIRFLTYWGFSCIDFSSWHMCFCFWSEWSHCFWVWVLGNFSPHQRNNEWMRETEREVRALKGNAPTGNGGSNDAPRGTADDEYRESISRRWWAPRLHFRF